MAEFELIDRFFKGLGAKRTDVVLGVGDDGALISAGNDVDIVTAAASASTVSTHSFSDRPAAFGHRVLATAQNRLAALGASPAWATLSVTLPQADEAWLQEFCHGMDSLAKQTNTAIIGGDTTTGPFGVTAVVNGVGKHLDSKVKRDPEAGDAVLISGVLGGSALAMLATANPAAMDNEQRNKALTDYAFPMPRCALAEVISKYALVAADLSVGLESAMAGLLVNLDVGLSIDISALPVRDQTLSLLAACGLGTQPLITGSDHELLFFTATEHVESAVRESNSVGVPVTCVGHLSSESGFKFRSAAP